MTTVYFVRHAQPNYDNHDDASRELSEKGIRDRELVTAFLAERDVDLIFSSPYKRAVDTVADFAYKSGLEIHTVEGFRERKVDSCWIEDFDGFCRRQWADFDYKLSDGETLREVESRNIAALNGILDACPGKRIVIGGHGTAISTVLHYFDPAFGYGDFCRIKHLMPWVVKLTFEGNSCLKIEEFDLFG